MREASLFDNLESIKDDNTLVQIKMICTNYASDPTSIQKYTEESVRRMYHYLVGIINELEGTKTTLNVKSFNYSLIEINHVVELYAKSENYDEETIKHEKYLTLLINKELDNIKLMLSILSIIISTHFSQSFELDNPYSPYTPLRYKLH